MSNELRTHVPRGSFPPMWVIYQRPTDMPEANYVVRLWYGESATAEYECFDDLRMARLKIYSLGGGACLPRDPLDPPTVVEVWL